MSQFDETSDPRPGIRAVLLSGFFTGDICGLLYASLTGHLFASWWSDPYALLALGAILVLVGILGTLFGAMVGLSARILLHGMRIAESWWPPTILSALVSASLGLWVAAFLIAWLSESAR